MYQNLLNLTQKLISVESITPKSNNIYDIITSYFVNFDPQIILKSFGKGEELTDNIYIELVSANGLSCKNLCFVGHVDVVPTGNIELWNYDPWSGKIVDDIMYGRGMCDMKGAIACFMDAAKEYMNHARKNNSEYRISILLTSDEEGSGINGIEKFLPYLMHQTNTHIDYFCVGEPTATKLAGDTIKTGRRGSVSFNITIEGEQGHLAYAQLAKNPIYKLSEVIMALKGAFLDDGNKFFDPSNLEFSSLSTSTNVSNVIPKYAYGDCNIRFNTLQDPESLVKKIEQIIEDTVTNSEFTADVKSKINSRPFLLENHEFISTFQRAIEKIIAQRAQISTSGGTSDARYTHKYAPTIECGVSNATAHKIDEHVTLEDLFRLRKIYFSLLEEIFENNAISII